MSDSESGEQKGGVPSWQRVTAQKPLQEEDKPKSKTDPTSTAPMLAQARKFLEDEEVKDAPTDKKIAFLESKGVRSEDVQELLGISRNLEASNTTPPMEDTQISKPPPPQPSPTPSPPRQQQQNHPPLPTQPPIITYPEFLTTSPRPDPLITKPRLLKTLYAFSFLSLLLYGTSNYLVAPMISSLTTARLSLASTTSTNLRKLIEKLEKAVSTIPISSTPQKPDDSESEPEDPTELYHRDIGIQTSPPSSPTLSPSPTTPLDSQTTTLSTLSTSLKSLITSSDSEGENSREFETTIGYVKEMLEGMAYVQPPTVNYGYGGFSGGGAKEDDEIARVKAGIRGVKGVLLSAKSFPGGVRGVR